MIKWIRVEQDGSISLVSESFNSDLIEIELTEEEYENILLSKLLYINNQLVDNPNWTPPEPTLEEQIQELKNKRDFGQSIIFEFMIETNVEGLFNTNPMLAQTTINTTKGLFDALNAGWLNLAILQIKSIPSDNLNSILTEELLLKYRNKLHEYLNINTVLNYND